MTAPTIDALVNTHLPDDSPEREALRLALHSREEEVVEGLLVIAAGMGLASSQVRLALFGTGLGREPHEGELERLQAQAMAEAVAMRQQMLHTIHMNAHLMTGTECECDPGTESPPSEG